MNLNVCSFRCYLLGNDHQKSTGTIATSRMTKFGKSIFSHGQLYVAFSRVEKLTDLFVYTKRIKQKYCVSKSTSTNITKTKCYVVRIVSMKVSKKICKTIEY